MKSLPLKKINDEVYTATEAIIRLDRRAIEFTRECALRNPRGRARICAHRNPDENLHEMLIAITAASYVRPHRHHGKSESFHLVEGEAEVVILSDEGSVEDVIALGPGANFYYRLDAPRYHTVLPGSPVLVIHETTNGPFDPAQTDWAAFAPAEGSPETAGYTARLRQAVHAWKNDA
jgi:cupin fold WbuC family metalloprotein